MTSNEARELGALLAEIVDSPSRLIMLWFEFWQGHGIGFALAYKTLAWWLVSLAVAFYLGGRCKGLLRKIERELKNF